MKDLYLKPHPIHAHVHVSMRTGLSRGPHTYKRHRRPHTACILRRKAGKLYARDSHRTHHTKAHTHAQQHLIKHSHTSVHSCSAAVATSNNGTQRANRLSARLASLRPINQCAARAHSSAVRTSNPRRTRALQTPGEGGFGSELAAAGLPWHPRADELPRD